ncbi:anaerobic ribonucleoside-triphosphate reductase activating protein [endosymbiont 'TC1' of Trimyema compressum]|uniref:anaerobic ribonucleoside-triphosphate reductase activating protein n=1 Tax=endosymbiont 'TC1' of Trimyema compressum TaxID=243899 RepID=UPI000B4C49FC|nr:anaerobic ribonucleoside-triphosphate reductase activating protein [endosymbiont 'TC1' of Trimyema compressum]
MDAYQLRIANIIEESIVDGPGIRFVIFVQGCPHHCLNCHNKGTHSFDGGTFISLQSLFNKIMENPLLDGVTFSGGEPFVQSEALAILGSAIKEAGLNLMTYTGYTLEQLREDKEPYWAALLAVTDILVDGPYIEEEKSMLEPFKGSANQRIITLKN